MVSRPTLYSRHAMSKTLISLSGDVVEWDVLSGKACVAFAGIARPTEFFDGLKEQGLKLVEQLPLDDHQQYDDDLLDRLIERCQYCDALITTEKDAVKLTAVKFPVPCYQVGVALEFTDTTMLDDMLKDVIASTHCVAG